MGKKKKYRLTQRNNGVFYFKLPGFKTWKTTKKRDRDEAVEFVTEYRRKYKGPESERAFKITVRDYFVWLPEADHPRCPYCHEKVIDGKQISPEHAKRQRSILERFIFTDPLADLSTREITSNDIRNFKIRLDKKQLNRRTINAVLTVLRCIFNDLFNHQKLTHNPVLGVSNVKHVPRETGAFTEGEIQGLFPLDGIGPWKELKDFTVFYTAFSLGLRRGEALALRWGHVDFENRTASISEAWKNTRRIGQPKWNRPRVQILPERTATALKEYREECSTTEPTDLIFSHPDSTRLGTQWWKLRWNHAMDNAGFPLPVRIARNLRPHSLRHSLATILKARGVPDEFIRLGLGWSNVNTQDTYTHLRPENLAGIGAVVDEVLGE